MEVSRLQILSGLLSQSDCSATRVHLGKDSNGLDYVLATCAPGATNPLQFSTNLVDWVTAQSTNEYYQFYYN